MGPHSGVVFSSTSTSETGRQVLSDALSRADPVGSRSALHETNWRRGYVDHFRRAVEAGTTDPDHAVWIASDGLQSLRDRFHYDHGAAGQMPVDAAFDSEPTTKLRTETVTGTGRAEDHLAIHYRGERLSGPALLDQLDDWTRRGVITESCGSAVAIVADHPEWLRLADHRVVILGAAAEMSPMRALVSWGAEVVAIDLPRADSQARIDEIAAHGAGTVHIPVRDAGEAGADLIHELPDVARWIERLDGRLVLGNYCYADGATHVRVSMAADGLSRRLVSQRPDTALAFLATPTDTFAVPAEDVDSSTSNYRDNGVARYARAPLRWASGGRLLQRNYPPMADPGICDALVPQQGPNYALAKRAQRWRAIEARHDGTVVSMNVAPATRTRSVMKNKALAAAYAGAHRFGVEVFEPATSSTLMAALLVYDLQAGAPAQAHPWQDEAINAAHGGLWTAAYHARSVLGLAAVLGIGGVRS